ncbi:quinol dehydrogenase ferredoxin subunit NapH [Bordetella petrii]|uniref:quinol dehydrogenase ferredoxin subunit NapH n=1 Tax=Bordetella petrii TaxID=94624 RepID=UPI001E317506|nr:quinol dehydrogenase ferredoxin subunit NapH [Bordetella petrii]MCD0501419.1 quinol dehydrogenase ferredoxin subunit NapH [Bordetella petrii]
MTPTAHDPKPKRPSVAGRDPTAAAIAGKGWLQAHRWLLCRRAVQTALLAVFLVGPATVWLARHGHLGQTWWPVKGNLASSLTLDWLPLSDPYVLLQSLLGGHAPLGTALLGGAIVLAFYLLLGGRLYCAWVCPINPVTDAAAWLRRKLKLRPPGRMPSKALRLWLLAATLLASAATGTIAWEWVNPVSMLHRALVFGFGAAWALVLAVFLYDLLVAPRGWCGHVCPVGAFYGLLGKRALLRVNAAGRAACDDCMDCYAVCPEPQVIRPALKQAGQTHPVILASDCTTCGRCIDVCPQHVFRMSHRFRHRSEP